jgi:DNA polymerase (family 10)
MAATVTEPKSGTLGNAEVAKRLEQVADLLSAQHANPFRVRAYRGAARTVENLDRPVHALLEEEGLEGLRDLPGIGDSLARAIDQLARTGRLGLLERLRGSVQPVDAYTTVPGIGPGLAGRIHEELGIETLEDLEMAAHDGRLTQVPGLGPRRVQAVRDSLAAHFLARRSGAPSAAAADPPPVAELLAIDREYRRRAEEGKLATIAPRRFNPTGAAWLPIMHATRGERHYTVLYSNTARAHLLDRVRDWVVIFRDDHVGRGQWTVVTARNGSLKGRRVVRGREPECGQHYAAEPDEAQAQGDPGG